MNSGKLNDVIKRYKNHIRKVNDIKDINERKERMKYYQSWTADKINTMTEDEFVEYIGKLWSMIVWENKKYIADKIIELNGFNKIKKYVIDLFWVMNLQKKRWDYFSKNIKQIGPSSMSELLTYINPNEYVICNRVTCNCFRYLEVEEKRCQTI